MEVKILLDTDSLVQIQMPENTAVLWLDGALIVHHEHDQVKDGLHPNGIPIKMLWNRKCPRPTMIAQNDKIRGFWKHAPEKCRGIHFLYFEIAVNPLIKFDTATRTFFFFGEDQNMDMRGGKDPIHQACYGWGKIALANRIIELVDAMRSRNKCKQVYVIYRIPPTVLPADDHGGILEDGSKTKRIPPAFGAVVYCEVAMFGV
jgi:hypothetical protein